MVGGAAVLDTVGGSSELEDSKKNKQQRVNWKYLLQIVWLQTGRVKCNRLLK